MDAGKAAVFVRCFAAITAVLADELELPMGALPQLLRAALDNSARLDGPNGREPFWEACAERFAMLSVEWLQQVREGAMPR